MKEQPQGPGPIASGGPDLKAIRERAEKATEEPWHLERPEDNLVHVSRNYGDPIVIGAFPRLCIWVNSPVGPDSDYGAYHEVALVHNQPDADFIAHAREDIPLLLKELAEARESAATWEAEAQRFDSERCAVVDAAQRTIRQREEAQAKLDAVTELRIPHHYKCSCYDDNGECDCYRRDLDATLGGSEQPTASPEEIEKVRKFQAEEKVRHQMGLPPTFGASE